MRLAIVGPMIDVAISHVAAQLNQSLRSRFGVAEDLVAISSLLEQDGSVVPEVSNKVVAFLVNVERETLPYRVGGHSGGPGRSVVTNAPVYLNLLVMFAANFGGRNYAEALKFLSGTIGFFQARPAFDPQSSPGLDPRIDKLTLPPGVRTRATAKPPVFTMCMRTSVLPASAGTSPCSIENGPTPARMLPQFWLALTFAESTTTCRNR